MTYLHKDFEVIYKEVFPHYNSWAWQDSFARSCHLLRCVTQFAQAIRFLQIHPLLMGLLELAMRSWKRVPLLLSRFFVLPSCDSSRFNTKSIVILIIVPWLLERCSSKTKMGCNALWQSAAHVQSSVAVIYSMREQVSAREEAKRAGDWLGLP